MDPHADWTNDSDIKSADASSVLARISLQMPTKQKRTKDLSSPDKRSEVSRRKI